GLELVELKRADQAAPESFALEHPAVEGFGVVAEQRKPSSHRSAGAAEDSGRLSVRDLGDEEGGELGEERGLVQAVVESEGLDGKGPPAAPAEEALDEAAVTLAAVAAVEAVLEVTVRTCRAIGMGAACGSKTHGVLLPGARLGPGQRD